MLLLIPVSLLLHVTDNGTPSVFQYSDASPAGYARMFFGWSCNGIHLLRTHAGSWNGVVKPLYTELDNVVSFILPQTGGDIHSLFAFITAFWLLHHVVLFERRIQQVNLILIISYL